MLEFQIRPARAVRSFQIGRLPALQITAHRIAVAMPRTYRVRVEARPTAPAPAEPAVLALDPAALAWREGQIRKARTLYQRMLRQRPRDWRARFQLAWLDAAFGRLDLQTIADLDQDDLTAHGRHCLRALTAAQQQAPLIGGELEWDAEVMRKAGAGQDGSWWQERGREASRVGLYGVAAACGMPEAERHADLHLQRIADALP